jgi:acetaldehyde dehydrogenase (acetylating)
MPTESPLPLRKTKIAPTQVRQSVAPLTTNAWNAGYTIICDKQDDADNAATDTTKEDNLRLLAPQKFTDISIIIAASSSGGHQLKKASDVRKSKLAYLKKYFPWNVPWVLVSISVLQVSDDESQIDIFITLFVSRWFPR